MCRSDLFCGDSFGESMPKPDLIIFYDSLCPLCVAEMDKLKLRDKDQRMDVVSLQTEGLAERFPELDMHEAMTILQGRLATGEYIEGLDVTHKAWSLVGKGYLTFVLRLPILRIFFDIIYRTFARHRYRISEIVIGKPLCASCCKSTGGIKTHDGSVHCEITRK